MPSINHEITKEIAYGRHVIATVQRQSAIVAYHANHPNNVAVARQVRGLEQSQAQKDRLTAQAAAKAKRVAEMAARHHKGAITSNSVGGGGNTPTNGLLDGSGTPGGASGQGAPGTLDDSPTLVGSAGTDATVAAPGFWDSLTTTEKVLLIIGAVLAIIFIFFWIKYRAITAPIRHLNRIANRAKYTLDNLTK